MELNSPIKDTWKVFTYGFFLACLILVFLINHNHQTVSISAARDTLVIPPSTPINADVDEITAASNSSSSSSSSSSWTGNISLPPPMTPINIADEQLNASSNSTSPPPPAVRDILLVPLSTPISNITVDQFNASVSSSSSTSLSSTLDIPTNYSPESREKPINQSATTDSTKKKCNIFQGRWVYKEEETPHYSSTTCPFLEEKMSCRKNGRPDFEYEKWVWENPDCDIPMFNGRELLERMRGKRMIVVGDSLNRNLWESLACLLYTTISPSRAHVDAGGPAYKVLRAKDYEFTVEFYWSPFLVELNLNHESGRKVLILDKLSPNAHEWQGADVMLFNSGHWWIHQGKLRAWDLFQYDGELFEDMKIEIAYETALKTWANWINETIDSNNKTTVFFRSISPEHKGQQWCYNTTQPIMDESYISIYPRSMTEIVESQIRRMENRVRYLNITQLSSYRRDAHPSVYRSKVSKIITEKYKRLVSSYADCSHWCLPGLPDTWNRLLYSSLFFDSSIN
ncbi:hypothetical protein Ancab_007769 [Ancistrocladus abbreviatus]